MRTTRGASVVAAALFALVASCGGTTQSTTLGTISETEAPSSAPPVATLPPATAMRSAAISTGFELIEYPVTAGSHPHDVAPAADGGVWYTGQRNGTLGHLDPATGDIREIDLGAGSAPHGVIVGPDGAPWITDGGLNAIVRVDPATEVVEVFELPASHPDANLNTAAFDRDGVLWFTGQSGMYGQAGPG